MYVCVATHPNAMVARLNGMPQEVAGDVIFVTFYTLFEESLLCAFSDITSCLHSVFQPLNSTPDLGHFLELHCREVSEH